MIKRYYIPVLNPLPGFPSYVLMFGDSPESAIAYVELFGYLVIGDVVEFG